MVGRRVVTAKVEDGRRKKAEVGGQMAERRAGKTESGNAENSGGGFPYARATRGTSELAGETTSLCPRPIASQRGGIVFWSDSGWSFGALRACIFSKRMDSGCPRVWARLVGMKTMQMTAEESILTKLVQAYANEGKARELLEAWRWPGQLGA